jgi:hypothetical protein
MFALFQQRLPAIGSVQAGQVRFFLFLRIAATAPDSDNEKYVNFAKLSNVILLQA